MMDSGLARSPARRNDPMSPAISPLAPKTFPALLGIAGVRFVPVTFTPSSGTYTGQACRGVNLIVTDRNVLDSPELGIELASALQKLYADHWKLDHMLGLLANQDAFDALARGDDPRGIAQAWQEDVQKFRELRAKYLLYK